MTGPVEASDEDGVVDRDVFRVEAEVGGELRWVAVGARAWVRKE